MPWFYVDDGFSDSKPVLSLPDHLVRVPMRLAACGLWVLAGSWSAKEELDGFIPAAKLKSLGAPRSVVAALCDPGALNAPLCDSESDGISVRNWAKWQKTKAENEAARKREAEKKRTQRRRGRNYVSSENTEMSPGDTDGDTEGASEFVSPGDSPGESRGPDPTHPLDVTHVGTEHSRNVGGDERGLSEPVAISASRLVAIVIPDRFPAAVRTALRIQASALMVGEGIDSEIVGDGLRRWLKKPGAGPGLLPSLVADVMRSRATTNGAQSTSDRRFAETQALKAKYLAEEQKEITE